MKRLLELFAILLLLILATSVFFLFSFHPDRYKGDFLRWVNQQSDWQLSYQSSTWSLSQPLSIELNGVQLAKPNQAALMVPHLQLDLAALPLLRGQISLAQVSLEQAQFALRPALLQTAGEAANQADRANLAPGWFEQLQIQQLRIKDSSLLWQQEQQSYQLQHWNLSLEDWQIDLAHPSPSNWRWRLHSDAEKLSTAEQDILQPQLALQYAEQRLSIEHLGADLWQGSIYASGELANKQLRIPQLVVNNVRLEHLAKASELDAHEPLTPAGLVLQLPTLSWLEQIDIDSLLLNQISLATRVAGHNFVVNRFTGELEKIHSSWPIKFDDLSANYAFIADEIAFEQLQFSELTASGRLQQQHFKLDALRSDIFKGQLHLAFDYHWQQAALNIQQFTLSNSEIPIQPSWLNAIQAANKVDQATENTAASPPKLQRLYIEQLDLQQVKVLSYLDQLPFSAEGLNLELRQLELIKAGQWQDIEQLWQASSQLFIEAPELAFRGLSLSHISMDIGSEQQLGYFNFYGELPLGQFEVQGQALLDQQDKPWQAELSGLLLDVSPLARLADNRDFKLLGDITFNGKLRGKLHDFSHSLDGNIDLYSQLIQLPGADLEVTLDHIIESPRQYYEQPSPLIENGFAVFWQQPGRLPQGITQFTDLSLNATIAQGKLNIAPLRLPGLRYQLTVQGDIDLAAQRFDNLQLVVSDQPCWRLVHTLNGDWHAPLMSFDHYRSERRYLVSQQQFVAAPQHSCHYASETSESQQAVQ